MPSTLSDRPSSEDYIEWYYGRFGDDLGSGSAEQWYEQVTDTGVPTLEGSAFWQELRKDLTDWNARFRAEHQGYYLFEETQQPKHICTKTFESVLNKSFRWNVLENCNWPDPPEKAPSTAPKSQEPDRRDPKWWFGPHNWLTDFPDIFRTRLTTTYFDGVGFLAERVEALAEQTTSDSPCLRLRASHDGHHAAHLWIYHELGTTDYDYSDPVSVRVRLEIQVATTIHTTISEMLHRVYEDWRVTGRPRDWEWEHDNPAFSINYLGSTLHYLEGMIVVARDKVGTSS